MEGVQQRGRGVEDVPEPEASAVCVCDTLGGRKCGGGGLWGRGGLCAVFSCHRLQLLPCPPLPLQVMRGHTNNIVDIAWSPDAKQIASAW